MSKNAKKQHQTWTGSRCMRQPRPIKLQDCKARCQHKSPLKYTKAAQHLCLVYGIQCLWHIDDQNRFIAVQLCKHIHKCLIPLIITTPKRTIRPSFLEKKELFKKREDGRHDYILRKLVSLQGIKGLCTCLHNRTAVRLVRTGCQKHWMQSTYNCVGAAAISFQRGLMLDSGV